MFMTGVLCTVCGAQVYYVLIVTIALPHRCVPICVFFPFLCPLHTYTCMNIKELSDAEYIPMVRRYIPNPRGTKNVFSEIPVLSIQIYVLSLSCRPVGINLVLDKGPGD